MPKFKIDERNFLIIFYTITIAHLLLNLMASPAVTFSFLVITGMTLLASIALSWESYLFAIIIFGL
ncbi:MAG: hypothetical protein ACPGJV_01195, partial [Bacteriovoracaceae bacterium]